MKHAYKETRGGEREDLPSLHQLPSGWLEKLQMICGKRSCFWGYLEVLWLGYSISIPVNSVYSESKYPPLDLGHFVLKSIWPVTNGIMKFICRMSGWWTEQIMLKMDSAWKHAEIEMIPKWLNDEKQQTEQSQISRFFCQVQIPLETMKGVHWAAVAACSPPAATNPQKSRT